MPGIYVYFKYNVYDKHVCVFSFLSPPVYVSLGIYECFDVELKLMLQITGWRRQ